MVFNLPILVFLVYVLLKYTVFPGIEDAPHLLFHIFRKENYKT